MNVFTKIRRNEYFKSAIVILVIVAVVLGFFFGLQFGLGTSVPVRVVESGSMCVPYDGACDGLTHPFDQTLHVGDIIVIQKVNPATLNTNYPNSDIIVYENPDDQTATPIVHRIVTSYVADNGTIFFQTKGDGNGLKWPATPSVSQYDSNSIYTGGKGVSQDLVIGKVVMRIPWFGWVTLFLRNNPLGLPVIIGLIMLLVVLEFVIPLMRKKKPEDETQKSPEVNDFTLVNY